MGLWAVGPDLVDALLRHGAFDAWAARETGLARFPLLFFCETWYTNRDGNKDGGTYAHRRL